MSDCNHDEFNALVNVFKVSDVPGLVYAEIAVQCTACGEPLTFHGVPHGSSAYRPTVSLDGKELSAPATIGGAEVPPGLSGFGVTMVSGRS